MNHRLFFNAEHYNTILNCESINHKIIYGSKNAGLSYMVFHNLTGEELLMLKLQIPIVHVAVSRVMS